VEAKIRDAVTYHQAGELARAENLYQDVLREQPGNVDALHLLGLVAHARGRNDEAKRLISDAISRQADCAFYHNNLGEVLRELGDVRGAVECYRRALELDGGYTQARNNLGMALQQLGDLQGAADCFRQALDEEPGVAHLHNNLGVAEQALGNLDAAIASFRRSLELDAKHAEASNNLGAALHARGDLDDAEAALRAALEVDPRLAKAHYNLARLQVDRGDLDEAMRSARKSLELAPGEPEFHINYGEILRMRGQLDESIESLRAAIAINPRHAIALNDLGVSLLIKGRFDESASAFRRALTQDPGLAMAYENLAKARRYVPEDRQQIDEVERLAAKPGLSDNALVHIHFALGKMYDDIDEFEEAFRHFEAGNRLKRAKVPFDAAACRDFVDRTCAIVDETFLESRRDLGHPSDAPIFIIGLPRSGTTLVEQILATHPQVHGGGEINYFRAISRVLPEHLGGAGTYPECLSALDAATIDEVACAYLDRYGSPETLGDARRFTDKMPLNFEHLGLVALTFPNASIVHCRRDPMDLCLSLYFQHFAAENAYAYAFEDIAAYHRQYRRLMAHWHRALPGRICDVDYEALVERQEETTRALLEAVGLTWDESCLEFWRTQRPVGTSSHWQVRQLTGA